MQLEERVFSVKKRFLAMYKMAHAGHIGSSLSCAEILVFLKYAWMRDEDTFILSKGHAVAALYALLAEANALDPRELDTFYEDGTRLPALPPVNAIKEIPFATGSLGHGLSLCAGMAVGAILNRSERRFFCLTSDGELDEGSTWEAALFIAHRKLTNVVWLIDRNRIQGIGGTEEVLALEPLDAKLDAFGFHVVAADGHDFAVAARAARRVHARSGEPGKTARRHLQHRSRVTAFVTCKTRWLPTTCRWTMRSTRKLSTSWRSRMRPRWRGPAMRDEFAQAMVALFRERSDLVFLTGDVGFMALEGIAQTYGARFINAGVAEQNMVSLAAGLAREGHLPWVYSMAPFVAFRPYEQIRTDVCLHRLPVKLVGNGGGYGYGIMGATHHALEDVGAMRVLPNMRLYVPLTATDVGQVVEHDGAGSPAQLPAAQHRRANSGRGSAVRAVAEDQARADDRGRRVGASGGQSVRDGRSGLARRARDLERRDVSPRGASRRPHREHRREAACRDHGGALSVLRPGRGAELPALEPGRLSAVLHQPSRERISERTLRQPTLAPGGERSGGSSVARAAGAGRSWLTPGPPRLSAVIVCYLDAQAIPLMYRRLSDVFSALAVDYEIIFVNDGSPDDTHAVLKALTAKDDHVLAIEHSRNFGSQNAFLSGMELATGDAVVLLDGDLQIRPRSSPPSTRNGGRGTTWSTAVDPDARRRPS